MAWPPPPDEDHHPEVAESYFADIHHALHRMYRKRNPLIHPAKS